MGEKDTVVYFSQEANSEYKRLQERVLEQKERGIENSFDAQLLKAIDREKLNLKTNPQKGIHIKKRNITKQVVQRYNTDKLWKLDLVGFWRMIYTIMGDEVRIITFILEIMDHRKYDKVFGYRKK
jgi:mRNA-degrading endonuclease RelE of RelBE toxin-antitoxin system